MPVVAIRDSALSMARSLKDKRPDAPLLPLVLIYRGSKPVAMITHDDDASRTCSLAAWGFDADYIALIAERPDRETIVVLVANRADDLSAVAIDYTANGKGIAWDSPQEWTPEGGTWATTIRRAMSRPSAAVALAGDLNDMSREQRDMWIAEQIMATAPGAWVAFIGDQSDMERYERLREYGSRPAGDVRLPGEIHVTGGPE